MATTPVWNALSTLIVNAAFEDQDAAPVTPATATYRVEDMTNSRIVVPTTALVIGPGVTDIDIELTPAQMAIFDPDRDREARRIVVRFTYGSARAGNGFYDFEIRRV